MELALGWKAEGDAELLLGEKLPGDVEVPESDAPEKACTPLLPKALFLSEEALLFVPIVFPCGVKGSGVKNGKTHL